MSVQELQSELKEQDARGPFNHEMLTLARESRGLSQTDFKRALGISQSEVSKIENGFRAPSEEQVRKFATVLRYEEEFFFLRELIRNFGTSCVYHRKRKTTREKVLRQILAMVNVCRIQIRRLLVSVDLEIENKFTPIDIEDHLGNAEKIAQMVRAIWKLPPGPIPNLVREIENAGGIVIRCDFGTTKVDAVSQWLPELPPLFFVNVTIPTDRLRFTLAHEIGHIVMHQIPTEDMEREADRFAAELLMPKKDIKADLYDVTLPKLTILKQRWRVAMSALLMRACDLHTITPRLRSYLWTQMGVSGYRTLEPVTIPPEEPELLDEIVTAHRKELGYSAADLSKLVYGLETGLRDSFKTDRYHLRIVG